MQVQLLLQNGITFALRTFLGIALSQAIEIYAHIPGQSPLIGNVGDTLTYVIKSDVAEEKKDTDYYLASTYDTSKLKISPEGHFPAYPDGVWTIECLAPGTNIVKFGWNYHNPPTSGSGVYDVEIIVREPGSSTMSAANHPHSASDGDPVNLFTGEFTLEEPPDIALGGTPELLFKRYYASGMKKDTLVQSGLGANWSNNFDWRAITTITGMDIVTWKGKRIRFERTGNAWNLVGNKSIPYQLVDSGANLVLVDPLDEHRYTFNQQGLLISISDGRGNTHILAYDRGLLLQVSDGLGRTLSFEHDGFRQLSSVSDGQRTVRFNFTGNSILSGAVDVLGNRVSYAYDAANPRGALLTSKMFPRGNKHLTLVYDAEGRVVKQTDANNHVRTFSYQAGNIATVTEGSKPPRSFVHNSQGELTAFTDENGQSALVDVGPDGHPMEVMDRMGNKTALEWHLASGKPAAIENANGSVTRFTYAARTSGGATLYDLTEITFYDGTKETFTYDANGNVLTRKDRGGHVWQFTYNSRGQITSVINPAGGVFTQTFNSDGTVAGWSDGEMGTTSYTYDSLRRITTQTNPDGTTKKFTYDALDRTLSYTDERNSTYSFVFDSNGNLTTVTDPTGKATRLTYDNMDRMVSHTDRTSATTSATFDEMGLVKEITNRNGYVAKFVRDAAYRLTRVIDPKNNNWDYSYDKEGGRIGFVDPRGKSWQGSYDPLRYLDDQTDALGNKVQVTRDIMARLVEVVDPMGRRKQMEYDARGLLTAVTMPAIGTARYEYNALGLLSAMVDPSGSRWTFGYTKWGRRTSMVDPLNRSQSLEYDNRGRVKKATFADGTTCEMTYDGLGNIVRKVYSSGLDLNFTFDALNRISSTAGLDLSYDPEGRVINTKSAEVEFGATRDLDGRVIEVSYNQGALTVAYTYDELDHLTRVTDSLTGTQIDFEYDEVGRLIKTTRSNGVNGTYAYDAVDRAIRIQEGTLLDLQYTLNAAGEVQQAVMTAPLSSVPNAAASGNNPVDAAHQVSQSGFAYDARGRLTASPGHAYGYDGASRVTQIDGVSLTYNGLDGLQTRTENGKSTRYFYNHAISMTPIVAERDESTGQFLRYYIWTPEGRLLYMIDATAGNSVRFFHFDRTGSTRALTDSSGNVTDAYSYSPYGMVLARSGTNPQPFTFMGGLGVRAENNAGLYHMRARYYDAATARFLTPDPVWPNISHPQRLNPYQYGRQNPLRFLDPTGEAEVDMSFVSTDVGVFGHLFGGSDWFTSIDDLLTKIKNKLGPNDCLKTLTIVNHGSQGVRGFVMFDSENYVCEGQQDTAMFSNQHVQDKLRELATLFCRDGNIILRICRAGEGTEGDVVLKAIANLVRVPVTGPEDEIQASPWGGWSVDWKTITPDGYTPPPPPGFVLDPSGVAQITGSTVVR